MTAPVRRLGLVALAALAGCGQLLGIDDLHGPDPRPPFDAPPDVPIGPVVQISGTIRGNPPQQQMPVAGAQLEFYRLPQDARVATATSMPDGTYTLDVPTENMPLDGYVRASEPTGQFNTTFHYLPRPATAATTLDLEMFSSMFLSQVAGLYGTNHDPMSAAVLARVVAQDDLPVAGVPVQAIPLPLMFRYNNPNGFPSPSASATAPDGLALLFNAPLNTMITATGSIPSQTFGPASTQPTLPASCYFITLRSRNSP